MTRTSPDTQPALTTKQPLVTAAQIEKGCPTAIEVQALGFRIRAQLKTMRSYEAKAREKAGVELRKADDNWITVTQLLAEAKAKCNAGGFKAFKEKFCPDLSRSRVYQLLEIGDGKKTLEESRAEKRASVAKSRRGKKVSTTNDDVVDKPEVEPPPAAVEPEATISADAEAVAPMGDSRGAEIGAALRRSGRSRRSIGGPTTDPAKAEARAADDEVDHAPVATAHPLGGNGEEEAAAEKVVTDEPAQPMEQGGGGLGDVVQRDWHEAKRVLETLTAHSTTQVAQVIPPEEVALVTEIAGYFTALAAKLTYPIPDDGSLPAWARVP